MDKELIKARILEEIEKTENDIKEYKENIKPIAPDNSIGRLTRMDAIMSSSVKKTMQIKAEERLKRLKTALSNIEEDDFGYCLKCDEQISMERLLLIPESVCCVKCLNKIR